jgi:hypothetical protein
VVAIFEAPEIAEGRRLPAGYSFGPVEIVKLRPGHLRASVVLLSPRHMIRVLAHWRRSEIEVLYWNEHRGPGMQFPNEELGPATISGSGWDDPEMLALVAPAREAVVAALMATPAVRREMQALGALPPSKRCGCPCNCRTQKPSKPNG